MRAKGFTEGSNEKTTQHGWRVVERWYPGEHSAFYQIPRSRIFPRKKRPTQSVRKLTTAETRKEGTPLRESKRRLVGEDINSSDVTTKVSVVLKPS
jgi:hypothetical protein